MKPDLRVDQLLHGYARGHRLLASSLELPRDALRTIAVLSDLSGPVGASSFEPYLTVYPVLGSEFYAIARTWSADEMPRPGCVWTHTLLFPSSAMASVSSLEPLLSLLKRPDREDYSGYRQPVAVDTSEPSGDAEETDPSWQLHSLLAGIYASSDPCVVAAEQLTLHAETIARAIWNQQWPSLRLRFAFCTGAFDSRSIGTRPFDLQFIPAGRFRRARWALDRLRIIEDPLQSTAEPWLIVAEADLRRPGLFRDLIWEVGPAVGAARSSFLPAADLTVCVLKAASEEIPLSALTARVVKLFPSANDGTQAKKLLYGGRGPLELGEAALLREVVASAHARSFDWVALAVPERLAELWKRDPATAPLLREALSAEAGGSAVASAVAPTLQPAQALTVSGDSAQVLVTLVAAHPPLLLSPELWSSSSAHLAGEGFLRIAAEHNLATHKEVELTRAILAGCRLSPALVLEHLGESFVTSVLEEINRNADAISRQCLQEWTDELRHHRAVVERWVASVSELTVPALEAIVSAGAEGALDARTLPSEIEARELSDDALATLFILGATVGESRLVLLTFDQLHREVAGSHIRRSAWHRLDRVLPTLSWSRSWDRCERLRRGVARAFSLHEWPASAFLELTSDRDIFEWLARSATRVRGGREVVRHALEECRGSATSTWKAKALERALH